jgi:SAM-dependent methyltransferase
MMHRNKNQKEIWNEYQKILPVKERKKFNVSIGYCLHEKELKERLISSGKYEFWDNWKNITRPIIIKNRSFKYASSNYSEQRKIEYARRADNWNGVLKKIIKDGGGFENSYLINVGANQGDEVSELPFKITCIDPSKELCARGKKKYPYMNFKSGSADKIPVKNNSFDIYLSLRTWCIAGVLPDEALEEAKRVLKSEGLSVTSFPLRFKNKKRTLETAVQDEIKVIAKWTYSLFDKEMDFIETFSAPEDFFIYGRLKNIK